MSYSVLVDGKVVSAYANLRRAKSDYELIKKLLPDSVVTIVICEVSK